MTTADPVALEVAVLEVRVVPVGAPDDLGLVGEGEPIFRVDENRLYER